MECKNENLFWNIYRNKFLNYKIWSLIKKRERFTKRYKEIHSLNWMKKNYPLLLIDKIKKNQYLTFNEGDIKNLLQDDLFKFKNNDDTSTSTDKDDIISNQDIEYCLIQLRDFYKIDEFLKNINQVQPSPSQQQQFSNLFGKQDLDIIKLSILCENFKSLEIFSKNISTTATATEISATSTTTYLDDAFLKNNFQMIQFIYKEIGVKNFNNKLIYEYLFDKADEKIINFALDEMELELDATKIPIWSLFKLSIPLVERLIGNASDKVIQVCEPISSFNNFFYNFFQGTSKDLIYHSKLLLIIENIYRKGQLDNDSYTLNELSNLINQVLDSDSGSSEDVIYSTTKLNSIKDDSNISIRLLKLYVSIIFKRCWRNDFYFFDNGDKKNIECFSLVEYAIRFNDINMLELLSTCFTDIGDKNKNNNINTNKLIIDILEISCDYCNEITFNWGIQKFTKAKKFTFIKKVFKILNQKTTSESSSLDEIKLFIDNCIIKNFELINEKSFFQVLIKLENWELLNYTFYLLKKKLVVPNSTKILSTDVSNVYSTIDSAEFLEKIIKNREIFKFFKMQKWNNPETLFNRSRLDLIDVLDKANLLGNWKSNIDNASNLIINNSIGCDIVKYLVTNDYQFNQSILFDLVCGFNSKHCFKNSYKKFRLLLELCDDDQNGNITKLISYGRGLAAMMIYEQTPAAISFINDYRPYDLKNDRFIYKSNLLEMNIDIEKMFNFLLSAGKFDQLIQYITVNKSQANMLSFFKEIGKSGSLNLIKLYFNYLKQQNDTTTTTTTTTSNPIENTDIQPIPNSKNYLYSILSGAIKCGHFEVIKLFEKHHSELFLKNNWAEFIENFNPFSNPHLNQQFKILNSYIQNLINK